jgi:hypothetical protein
MLLRLGLISHIGPVVPVAAVVPRWREKADPIRWHRLNAPQEIGAYPHPQAILSRIQLNDELLIHDRGDFFSRGNAHDFALELVLIYY